MRSLLEDARAFMRPIADDEISRVRCHMLTGTRGLSLAGALFSLLSGILDSALGTYIPVVGQLYALGSVVAFLAIFGIGGTRWAGRHPHAVHFALGVLIMAAMGFGIAAHKPGLSEVSLYAPVAALVVAAFAPMRPVHALWLALPATAISLFVSTYGGERAPSSSVGVFVAIMCCTVAALAAQQRRIVLRQLANAQQQLAAAERMSALGRMTAGLAHELKTPLAAAATASQSLQQLCEELTDSVGHPDVNDDDLRDIAAEIKENVVAAEAGVRRASKYVQAIKGHTQGTLEHTPQLFSVADRVAAVLDLLSFRTRNSAVLVDTSEVEADFELRGDPSHFDQILTNLLVNALDACETAGGSIIRVATWSRDDGVVLAVEDDGPGVPVPIRARIFEPLFTTKQDAGGTGLGLTVSRDLAESRFGGTLEHIETGSGARFELYCPRAGGRASGRPAWVPAQASR